MSEGKKSNFDTEALKKMAQNQESKIVEGQKNERRALNQGFTKKATVYFKKNTDSQYHLDNPSTKVLIESCNGCTIKLNARIMTQMVEIWHCEDIKIIVNTHVSTLQLDLCKNVTVHFTRKEFLGSIIWAGLHSLKVIVGDDEESGDVLQSGVEQMKEKIADLQDNFDQFIVRYVDGVLLQELIVRLKNGFPTTDREADAFDAQQKKNDALFEKHVRKFMDSQFVEKKLETVGQKEGNEEEDTDASVDSQTNVEQKQAE